MYIHYCNSIVLQFIQILQHSSCGKNYHGHILRGIGDINSSGIDSGGEAHEFAAEELYGDVREEQPTDRDSDRRSSCSIRGLLAANPGVAEWT